MADAIRRVAREAMASLNVDQSPDEFVRNTTRLFRRPLNRDQKPKRGRPFKKKWKTSLFLLDKPLPSLKLFNKRLLKRGFGPPPNEVDIELDRSWSIDQANNAVIQSYPNHPLNLVSFKYARCRKGASLNLETIRHASTVDDLSKEIKAGKLYIVPAKELPHTQDCEGIAVDEVGEHFMEEEDLPSLSSEDEEIHEVTSITEEETSIV